MILTEEKEKEFREMSKTIMQWINLNCHPHVSLVADSTHVEILEGQYSECSTSHDESQIHKACRIFGADEDDLHVCGSCEGTGFSA